MSRSRKTLRHKKKPWEVDDSEEDEEEDGATQPAIWWEKPSVCFS